MRGRPLVYSHLDVDGITSARIATLSSIYSHADVQFTPFTTFGVVGLDVQPHHSEVLCLDIGCSDETLHTLSELSDRMKVTLIDHHPPDTDVSIDGALSRNFRIIVDEGHCTASLAYQTFKQIRMLDSEWAGFWAIVGIYGDMAAEKPGAARVLRELNEEYPEITPHLIEEGEGVKKRLTKKLEEQRYKHHPAKMLSRSMNMARRMAFHYGARVAYNACLEVEEANDPYLMVRNLQDYFDWAKYPNVSILRSLAGKYFGEMKNVRDSQRVIDIGPLAVGMITSRADLGGIIASNYSTSLGKSCFVYNDGLPEKMCKLSGRGKGDYNLNHILQAARRVSDGRVSGGGHPRAASGTFSTIPFWEVCRILYQAVGEVEDADDSEGEPS